MAITIPDAPWIREMETFGEPAAETIYCPMCHAEDPDEFTIDSNGDICGCDVCLKRVDAYKWVMDRRRLQ